MGARAVGVRVTEHDGRGRHDGGLDGDGNLQRHKRKQITGWRGAWVYRWINARVRDEGRMYGMK